MSPVRSRTGGRPGGGIAFAVATVGGAGLSPVAPGTAGTLATVPLYLLLAHAGGAWLHVAATLAILAAGIAAADRVSRALGVEDPGIVVVDETVGFLVTMTFVEPTVASVLLGLLIFRVLDVLKPLGIERLEQMPGGFGIMMDDFAAGVMGNVLLRLVLTLAASPPG